MPELYVTNAILTINNHTVEVCVKRKTDPQKQDEVGLGNLRLRFVGNVVNSGVIGSLKQFPQDVKVGDRGEITIDSEGIQGEFIIEDIHRTRWKAVENSLGQTFSGFLVPSKQYSESDWGSDPVDNNDWN